MPNLSTLTVPAKWLLALALMGAPVPLLADGDPTSGVERAYEFDIPAQSLESALNQLSRASSVSILNDSATVARKRSLTIKGRMTVQEAVLRLLKGTGLRARFTAGGAIAITPGAKAEIALDRIEAVDRPTIRSLKQEPAWIAYAEKVQARIRTGLSADRELARGRYDVRIKVWLTRDGKAMRVELARSSGERERDARLLRLADGMTMDDPPPPNLRLPMTLEFRVR